MDRSAVAVPGVGQVGEDVGLGVEPHRLPHKFLEVDAVWPTAESELDALVLVAVTQNPVGDAGVDKVAGRVGFEDAGPLRRRYLLPGAGVDHDRLDPGAPQQVRQHQAGWTCTDDSNWNRGNGVGDGIDHGIS